MPISRPLRCLESPFRQARTQHIRVRALTTATHHYRRPPPPPPPPVLPGIGPAPAKIRIYPPPPSARSRCPNPLHAFTSSELAILDPTSSRTRLIAKTNPDGVKVGDILLVRFKTGDPFAGVVMNIRRRGVDSGVLLRNQLTRVGTELWVKVYSPTVAGMEIVQRSERRVRRARAYYFRKPKHDRGNLTRIVDNYILTKRALGRANIGGSSKGKGAAGGGARSKQAGPGTKAGK